MDRPGRGLVVKINTKFAQTAREVLNRTIEDLRKQVITYALIEAYEVMEKQGLDTLIYSVETGTSDPMIQCQWDDITRILTTLDVEDLHLLASSSLGYDESSESDRLILDKDDVLARIRTAFPNEEYPQ